MSKTMVGCPACDTELDARGWRGHSISKVHKEALERMGADKVEPVDLIEPEEIIEPVDDFDEVVHDSMDVVNAYEARIAQLEKELAAQRPDKTLPELTAGNVEEVIGLKQLEAAAEGKLVSLNRVARREGRRELWTNPVEFEDLLAEEVAQLKADLVARQSQFARTEGSGTRTMKMMRPQNLRKPDGPWISVGVPVEGQVNNGAAGPGVNVYLMRDKGFKVMTPYRCELDNCWKSARFPQGNPKFCTEAHAAMIPKALGANRTSLSQTYTEQLV